MKQKHCILLLLLLLVYGTIAMAQTGKPKGTVLKSAVDVRQQDSENNAPVLDAQREKAALLIFLNSVQTQIVSAADAMPAVKYSFAPAEGEFKGVRTFGQQVKHLATTNHILAAAALGEEPPADAGDEQGPENIRTKSEILDYLNASFAHLGKAIDAIGDSSTMVKSSPISPLPGSKTTRLALTVEALIHAFDHYGQMVEYLRLNGVVPPASKP
ncbi:DinB family protein [Alloacidobacterium dinghuense]|uniref:DinB family protein n=1 Tax=Alloacidobacterium dinghuense TaxID=2763107 RepID=A0A7G8BPK1_9BACT|nr:DinB family protein [Alloacidobacterium dinghuense]QNI34471.1 DinB family protein [Alloacidobacterium dinghuense]